MRHLTENDDAANLVSGNTSNLLILLNSSGNFYTKSNPSGFIVLSQLNASGVALQNQITNINNVTGNLVSNTTGIPLGILNIGNAPTTSLLTVPLSINTYGGLSNLLGTPTGWLTIQVSGSSYKVPLY